MIIHESHFFDSQDYEILREEKLSISDINSRNIAEQSVKRSITTERDSPFSRNYYLYVLLNRIKLLVLERNCINNITSFILIFHNSCMISFYFILLNENWILFENLNKQCFHVCELEIAISFKYNSIIMVKHSA